MSIQYPTPPGNMIEGMERVMEIAHDAGKGADRCRLWGKMKGWPYVVIKNIERLESLDLFTYTMTITEQETAIIILEASGEDMAVKSFAATCRVAFIDALLFHLLIEAEKDGYTCIYIVRSLYDAIGPEYNSIFAGYRFKKVNESVMAARVPQSRWAL